MKQGEKRKGGRIKAEKALKHQSILKIEEEKRAIQEKYGGKKKKQRGINAFLKFYLPKSRIKLGWEITHSFLVPVMLQTRNFWEGAHRALGTELNKTLSFRQDIKTLN